MKIPSLFNFLNKPASRLQGWLHSREEATASKADINGYTLVDPVKGGRKLDLLMTTNHRHLESERDSDKLGKARWHVNNREQVYRPRAVKLDPQLEFIYEELGLASNLEPSKMTPPKQLPQA